MKDSPLKAGLYHVSVANLAVQGRQNTTDNVQVMLQETYGGISFRMPVVIFHSSDNVPMIRSEMLRERFDIVVVCAFY